MWEPYFLIEIPIKRKITSAIELMSAKTFINKICFKKQENLINKWLTEVDIINTKISEACEKADIDFLKKPYVRGGVHLQHIWKAHRTGREYF